jgi:hypothetical protein
METKDILKNVLELAYKNFETGFYPLSNAELIRKLGLLPTGYISENCRFFYDKLLKYGSFSFDKESLAYSEFLLKNIMVRVGYYEKASSHEVIEKFKKNEFIYESSKENMVDELIELRNLNKDVDYQQNYYLCRCGKYDLMIKEKNLEIRARVVGMELKQENAGRLSDDELLEEARTRLADLSEEIANQQADLKAKERLFTQMQIANKNDVYGKAISTEDYSDYVRERRNYIKQFTPYLAIDLDKWGKLTTLQQEKLQEFQQNFISNIKTDEIIINKNSMFAGLTSNYALESLLFQCEELYAAAGIDLPDGFIIYDCDTIEEMIDKLNRGITSFQFEMDKIKNRQREICEDQEYIKYMKLNALSDNEYKELIDKYMLKINELEDQLIKLDQEFRSM